MANKKKDTRLELSAYDRTLDADSQKGIAAAKQYGASTGDWASAHERAESIRNRAGFSGGADGSEYIVKRPEKTQTAEGTLLTQKAKQMLERKPFTYEPEKDALWQNYQAQYARAGEKAMQDTLAEVSARTGGMASSYAAQAAQGTFSDYMAALQAKLPQLYQIAYEMYRDEDNRNREDIQMLQSLNADAENNYRYRQSQADNDRAFAYRVAQDEQAAEEQNRRNTDQLLANWLSANGGYISAIPQEIFAGSSYPAEYWESVGRSIQNEQAALAAKASRSSGGSKSAKSENSVYDELLNFDDPDDALLYISTLKGYDNEQKQQMFNAYSRLLRARSAPEGVRVPTDRRAE